MWNILYDETLVGVGQWGPKIPDLCASANMTTTGQPVFVSSVKKDNDAWLIEFGSLVVGVHTNPELCVPFKGIWPSGRFFVDVDGKPVGHLAEGDLVLLDLKFGKPDEMIYLTVEKGNLVWLKAKGDGGDSYSFQTVPSLWVNPDVDGVKPWKSANSEPSPYLLGDKVYQQKPLVQVK